VLAVEEEEEEELELTQKLDTLGDLDIMDAAEPAPPQAQPVATLVSETVAAAAAASFGHLSASIAMPPSGLTLDDVVRELLRPLLQQWLDANLPTIVQEAVQAEVDRIARSRLR
jgi:cell pole-organizing protein PopZ